MPRTVVIDELHLTVRVPADLPDDEAEQARLVLNGEDFMRRLRRAVRAAARTFEALSALRISVSR